MYDVHNASLRYLGRLRGLYSVQVYRKLWSCVARSLIVSVSCHCCTAYGNSISGQEMERIQKLQSTTLYVLHNYRRYNHVSVFWDAANRLPLKAVCRAQARCLVHRVLKVREPQNLLDRLHSRVGVAMRSTRQDGQLHFQRVGRKGSPTSHRPRTTTSPVVWSYWNQKKLKLRYIQISNSLF